MNKTSIIYVAVAAQLLSFVSCRGVRTIAIAESQADVGGVAACTPIALYAVQKAFTLEFPLWDQNTVREILHAGTDLAKQGSAERNFICTEVDQFIPGLHRIQELMGNFNINQTDPTDPFRLVSFRDALQKLSEGDSQGVRGAGITTGGSTYGLARRGNHYLFFNSHANPANTPSGASARIFYSYPEIFSYLERFFHADTSHDAAFTITLYDPVTPIQPKITTGAPAVVTPAAQAPSSVPPAAAPGGKKSRRTGAKRKPKKSGSRRKKARR